MPDDGVLTAASGLRNMVLTALARLIPPAHAARAEFAGLLSSAAEISCADVQQRSHAMEDDRALLNLADALSLTPDEIFACALCREVEFDAPLSHAIAALQGNGDHSGALRPSLGLALRALNAMHCEQASDGKPLFGFMQGRALSSGLLQLSQQDIPLPARSLSLHGEMLMALAQNAGEIRDARFGAQSVNALAQPAWPCPPAWLKALHELAPALNQMNSGEGNDVLVLRARVPEEAAGVVAHLAADLHRRAVRINGAAQANRNASDAPSEITLAPALEAWLLSSGAVPVFVIDGAPGELICLPRFAFYRGPVLVACAADGELQFSNDSRVIHWHVPTPTVLQRTALWQAALAHAEPAADLDLTKIAQRYRCGVSTLWAIGNSAMARGKIVSEVSIAQAASIDVASSTHGLSALAQWISCEGVQDALVAPATLATELKLILTRCGARESMTDQRGAALVARYSPGVKLLFTGPSGTGKTLAAQWLAASLGKPFYRVDLAAVSSKYIGETEKNLAQLLARAEHLDCVLLFDEADSLFGNRTEVRQANDRFANSQTNYLLQRIESFEGIAVLTSNSKSRFDDAFMRRLDHVVEFPVPTAAERRALWLAHLGRAHALTASELNQLAAEIDLAGGHIRNIVLGAALAARVRADDGAPAFVDVQCAAVVEYAKLGRRPPDAIARVVPAAPVRH